MNENRITKKIFLWAESFASRNKHNWVFKCKSYYNNINLGYIANILDFKNVYSIIDDVKRVTTQLESEKWFNIVNQEQTRGRSGRNKLRTYKLFKQNFEAEPYVKHILPWNHRKALAQFRCRVAPIRIETGRYENLPENDRTCFNCLCEIENEVHVITECPLYADLRHSLYEHCAIHIPEFLVKSNVDKMCYILSCDHVIQHSAKTLYHILMRRRNLLYS